MTPDFDVESNYLGDSACCIWGAVCIVDHYQNREFFCIYPVFLYEGSVDTTAGAAAI